MKIIDREMTVKEIITDKSNHSLDCQASFNSDGVITLRNYNPHEKGTDDIIVFSQRETKAIIKLFTEINDRISNKNDLPF